MVERASPIDERLTTGVPGLDVILEGGLKRGNTYLIRGPSGAGKTVLANQIAFHHVGGGGRATYLTLLGESHGRMLANLQSLDFFKPAPVGRTLTYLSGYGTLEKEGMGGLISLVRQVVHEQRSSLFVLDGLSHASDFAARAVELKRFLHELQVFAEAHNCTTVLVSRLEAAAASSEDAVVDGIFQLSAPGVGVRSFRQLLVQKFRGGSHLPGEHFFEIGPSGIRVYPRLEARQSPQPTPPAGPLPVRPFGVAGLDQLLGGGLPAASITLLVGATGSGKTTMAMQFLSSAAEPSLFVSLREPPHWLRQRAADLGLPWSDAAGGIEVLWEPSSETVLDVLADRLLENVRRRGVRRLVLDGLGGLRLSAVFADRPAGFLPALMLELRAAGVSAIFTDEDNRLLGRSLCLPDAGVTETVDTVLLLRSVEERTRLHRLVTVLKARASTDRTATRVFDITPNGLALDEDTGLAERLLSGGMAGNA